MRLTQRSSVRKMLLFWVASIVCCAQEKDFDRICKLSSVPVLKMSKNSITGDYVILDETPADGPVRGPFGNDDKNNSNNSNIFPEPDNGGLRNLRSNIDAVVTAIRPSHRMLQEEGEELDESEVVLVRQCTCFFSSLEQRFCPVDKEHCGVPKYTSSSTELSDVGCFNQSSRMVLIRNAWPVVVLWYGALVLFLFLTEQGRHTRNFVYTSLCNSRYNTILVDRMLRPSDFFRARLWNPFWRRERDNQPLTVTELQDQLRTELSSRAAADQEPRPPTELALKTKRYVHPSTHLTQASSRNIEENEHDSDDEEEDSCTICFAPLQDGDRVGALPCDHTFHVECLKSWLTRRNVCPLCQAPDVAAPRYRPRSTEEMRGQTEDSNSIIEGNADNTEEPGNQDTQEGETSRPNMRVSDTFAGRVILRRQTAQRQTARATPATPVTPVTRATWSAIYNR